MRKLHPRLGGSSLGSATNTAGSSSRLPTTCCHPGTQTASICVMKGQTLVSASRIAGVCAMAAGQTPTSSASSSRSIEAVVPATRFGPRDPPGREHWRVIGTTDVEGRGTRHPLHFHDPFIFLDESINPFGAGGLGMGGHPHAFLPRSRASSLGVARGCRRVRARCAERRGRRKRQPTPRKETNAGWRAAGVLSRVRPAGTSLPTRPPGPTRRAACSTCGKTWAATPRTTARAGSKSLRPVTVSCTTSAIARRAA